MRIDAAGLPAGAHGVHIHATGKCEGPAFLSSGGHFNPAAKKHGFDSPDGPHAGDLAQIPPSFTGTGTHLATTDRVSLTAGAISIEDADGSALVVHAAADDQVTDPTGNTGARIACAVIAAAQPTTPTATATATATASASPAATTTTAPRPPATGSGRDGGSGVNALALALIGGLAATLGGAAVAIRRR